MKAITFDVSVPRYLLGKGFGRVSSSVFYGSLSGVRYGEVPDPVLPGPKWVKLEVLACGICGTDIGVVTLSASPILEPFGSFPAVIGHEILARVVEVGPEVTRVEPGQRVVVEPMISCRVRGYPEGDSCPSCEDGLPSTCERGGEDGPLDMGGSAFAPGLTIGYHRDLPGGWGEATMAHESQLFGVDDGMEDRAAVLIEPLSIGMHAVLRAPPRANESVLVLGAGPIGLGTVWALRATGFHGDLLVQDPRPEVEDIARLFGATEVIRPGPEARQALVDTGAMAYQPLVGPEVYSGGGFPLIYDCVGRKSSLEQALLYAAPRGRIVMLGCAAQVSRMDLTLLWARELDWKGFVGYGRERWQGEDRHTFEITQELIGAAGIPVDRMVTHAFPLSQYRDGLKAAIHRHRSGALKVIFRPDG
ncbi:zinc-binding dehydrogenase [Gemmatimonadota bacterium]